MKQIHLWAGLLLLVGCTSPTNENQKTLSASNTGLTDKDKEFFQKVTVNAYESFTKGNRAPYIDRYSADAIVMVPNMETLKGKEAIKQFILAYPSIQVEFPIVEILGNSNHANIRGTYVINDTSGKFLDRGKYVSIWQKDTTGRWELTRDIWNSDIPLPAEKN